MGKTFVTQYAPYLITSTKNIEVHSDFYEIENIVQHHLNSHVNNVIPQIPC